MEPRPRTLLLVAAIGLLLLVGACAPASAPSEAPASLPNASSAPTPSPDPSFEALVAEGIKQRTFLGLRADEEWVREVSADPGAKTEFGIPLTIVEQEELGARASSRQEIQPLLEQYAAEHPDEYAGLMIDQDAGGILVIMFSDHVEEHAAAVAQLVQPGSKVEVRRVPLSERDLLALMDRINSESELLQNAGVFVLVISTDDAGRQARCRGIHAAG